MSIYHFVLTPFEFPPVNVSSVILCLFVFISILMLNNAHIIEAYEKVFMKARDVYLEINLITKESNNIKNIPAWL